MIRARVRVVNTNGNYTILVCAESLREAERTVKARYPESTVSIAFPLEPESFFGGGRRADGYADLDATEVLYSTATPT